MELAASVQVFFESRPNFFCPQLQARILRLCCFKRMVGLEPGKLAKVGRTGSLLSAHCMSGECPLGRENLKLLRVDAEYQAWKRAQGS